MKKIDAFLAGAVIAGIPLVLRQLSVLERRVDDLTWDKMNILEARIDRLEAYLIDWAIQKHNDDDDGLLA